MVCGKCGISISDNENLCENCKSVNDPNVNLDKKSQLRKWFSVIFLISLIIPIFGGRILGIVNNKSVNQGDQALEKLNEGDSEEAIQEIDKALKITVDKDNKVILLVNKAYAYIYEGNNEMALNSLKEALALTKEGESDYYLISGEIAILENNAGIALENLNKAHELKPDDFQINSSLFNFYIDENMNSVDVAKALEYAKKADEVAEVINKDVAKENLAVAYYHNYMTDEALEIFLSFDLNKKPYTASWIAYSYLDKEDEQNAKVYFQKAKDLGIELNPEIEAFLSGTETETLNEVTEDVDN